MTREEREEAYNRARERIFGSSDKNGDSSQGNLPYRICQITPSSVGGLLTWHCLRQRERHFEDQLCLNQRQVQRREKGKE